MQVPLLGAVIASLVILFRRRQLHRVKFGLIIVLVLWAEHFLVFAWGRFSLDFVPILGLIFGLGVAARAIPQRARRLPDSLWRPHMDNGKTTVVVTPDYNTAQALRCSGPVQPPVGGGVLLDSRLQACRSLRDRPCCCQWMGVSVGRIGERPGICSSTQEQLTLRAASTLIPASLIRGPVTYACRTSGRTVGERAMPHSRRTIERRCSAGLRPLVYSLRVIVTVGNHPRRIGVDNAESGIDSGKHPLISRRQRLIGGVRLRRHPTVKKAGAAVRRLGRCKPWREESESSRRRLGCKLPGLPPIFSTRVLEPLEAISVPLF